MNVQKGLTSRQKKVLSCIVQCHVETVLPVGSKYLVSRYQLDWSSATVRNDMAVLEEQGYIRQPHTSAGRIPTDRAYRFYVDSLMRRERLSEQECDGIQDRIALAKGSVDRILNEASCILSAISKELAFVFTPQLSLGIFDRLELIKLSGQKALMVLRVRSRMVKTVILETESGLDQAELEKTAAILNERLSGLTLEEIQNSITDRISTVNHGNRPLMNTVASQVDDLFHFAEPISVHTSGTANILAQPEFMDREKLNHVFTLIDDRERLATLFGRRLGGVEVRIGVENRDKRLQSCAVVMTSYSRGNDYGTLGVIGPTRMPYNRILPLVDHVAKTMTQYLS